MIQVIDIDLDASAGQSSISIDGVPMQGVKSVVVRADVSDDPPEVEVTLVAKRLHICGTGEVRVIEPQPSVTVDRAVIDAHRDIGGWRE